jgi:cytochrome c oxidase assembly protein Cox11
MEELKYNEKRFNKKLLMIPILIIISVITVLGFKYAPSVPSNNIVTTTIPSVTTVQQYTVTGSNVFDKDVSSSEIVRLNAGRYSLSFSSNNAVVVSLGKNPNGFLVCCNINEPKTSGTQNFDINSGSDGEYLLKIDGDSQISHVTISQSLAF